MQKQSLKKFIYLSIAAAVATISLKLFAWHLTGSVGLLSDALESCVNLVAAVVALIMITPWQRNRQIKNMLLAIVKQNIFPAQ